MRRLMLVLALVAFPLSAYADESISGQWRTDMSHGVLISMDVLADGHWVSETVQDNKVVAQMAGTYEQTKSGARTGKLVFTPVKSKVSAEHGAAKVEEDAYTLDQQGKVLRLTTKHETMIFHKQPD